MAYTFKEIPESEHEEEIYSDEGNRKHEIDELLCLGQWEILDDEGDQIAVVHSESEAETLISHLNR